MTQRATGEERELRGEGITPNKNPFNSFVLHKIFNSFYFVGDELVMHNKASYRYTVEDRAQSKRSYDGRYESKAAGGDAKAESKAATGGGGGESTAGAKESGGAKDGPWSKDADYD